MIVGREVAPRVRTGRASECETAERSPLNTSGIESAPSTTEEFEVPKLSHDKRERRPQVVLQHPVSGKQM
jgi:hypothetical protein